MVIRTEKLTNYTKIDTTYLEDKNISLKAKRLLTLMLSLPDAWNFNTNGLRLLCKESKLAVTNALKELKENNILRVSDLSEVENGKLYNLKEKLLSQNPKCRTCKVNPFCWNCIATIKENTENGAMDDYCSKVKAFYFNTVWGE